MRLVLSCMERAHKDLKKKKALRDHSASPIQPPMGAKRRQLA